MFEDWKPIILCYVKCKTNSLKYTLFYLVLSFGDFAVGPALSVVLGLGGLFVVFLSTGLFYFSPLGRIPRGYFPSGLWPAELFLCILLAYRGGGTAVVCQNPFPLSYLQIIPTYIPPFVFSNHSYTKLYVLHICNSPSLALYISPQTQ